MAAPHTALPSSATSLFSDLEVDVLPDAPIGLMTWYGIGGHADLLVHPATPEALATLIGRCTRNGTPLRVLGGGANLLVGDEGIDGIVVRLDHPRFREIQFNRSGPAQTMRAMAGADLARTLMDTTRRGLAGLAQMAGIPGTVGGAVHMNAGGAYGSISDALRSVSCITNRGEIVTYASDELKFDYRTTNIPDPIIVAATFALEPDDPVRLRERVKVIFAYKKSTQPLSEHSAGCVFRNPIDPETDQRVSAGRLIDEAGLKGERIGGASVSRHHANFVVAEPGTRANDVLQLLDLIGRRVYEHCGIELVPEIAIWKRSDTT